METRYTHFMIKDRLDDIDEKTVGYIYDTERQEPVLGIYISTSYLAESNNRECVVNFGTATRKPLAIVSVQLARKLQRNHLLAWFQLYHELAHIVLKHREGRGSQEDVNKYRIEAVMAGGVDEHELEADAFAASIVGQDIAIRALRKLMHDRRLYDKERGQENSALAQLSQMEYKRRIMAIENPEMAE